MSLAARTSVALLLLSASLGASVAACSRPNETVTSAHSATTEKEPAFEPNAVLDDASMTDTSMTAADVQAFLDRTPYGKRSVLATYQPTKTKTAAQIIVDAAVRYEINPMLLVVRTQLENELVSKGTATEAALARAFGCGCAVTQAGTSTSVCTPTAESRGFENQARCAASQLRSSLDRLSGKEKAASATTDGTAKGWAANERHTTRDGIVVIPDNDATAVLYAYKPWVGKLGGGDPDVGGMSAHWKLWNDFTAPIKTSTSDPRPSPTPGVECSARDTSSCQADGVGDACIAGRCGCVTSVDCGDGNGRFCDRLHGVCVAAPTPSTPTTDDAGPSTPGNSDAGVPGTHAPEAPTGDPIPSEPTSSPTPDLPSSADDPSSSEGKRAADDKIEVPASDNGGCSSARMGRGSSGAAVGAWCLTLAVALSARLLRRRRPPSSSRRLR